MKKITTWVLSMLCLVPSLLQAKDVRNLMKMDVNNATLDHTEFRMGGDLAWKIAPGLTLELEAGYMIDREFDFHTADTEIESDGGPMGRSP